MSAVITVTQWSRFPQEVMTSNQASQKRRVPAMIAVTSINCRRFQVSQAKVIRTAHRMTSKPIHRSDQCRASVSLG
jgi:hypothetical protein